MKTNTASLSVLSTLVLAALLVIGILQQAHAQVDATSSDVVASTSTDTTPTADAATSTAAPAPTSSTAPANTATPSSSAAPAAEQPPSGLTLVHIVGTKYIDYFTDGTTVTAYPGDPAVDSNFNKPDAPIPTHAGLTWVHSTGGYLYDTPSGDLEVGDYAVQPNGSYITNAPRSIFISSTSTPALLGSSTSTSDIPSNTSSTSTTTPAPTDTTAPTTTSADAATTSSNQ